MEKKGIIEDLKGRFGDVKKSVNDINNSEGFADTFDNSVRFAGKLLRFATGVVTSPVVLALNVVAKSMPVIWETAIQAVHIPAALISKIVKHDSPYNGQTINKVGNKLGTIMEAVFDESSNIVQRVF